MEISAALAERGTNEGKEGFEDFYAKKLLTVLVKHYPYMAWRVQVDIHHGVVMLQSPDLTGRMGMIIHLKAMDHEGKKIVKFAGEYLERYRVTREKALGLRGVGADLKRNFRGEAVYDKD